MSTELARLGVLADALACVLSWEISAEGPARLFWSVVITNFDSSKASNSAYQSSGYIEVKTALGVANAKTTKPNLPYSCDMTTNE